MCCMSSIGVGLIRGSSFKPSFSETALEIPELNSAVPAGELFVIVFGTS